MKFSDLSYDTEFDELPSSDITVLEGIVACWDEEMLEPAFDVLTDYFGITAPYDLIRNTLKNNLKLAFEVYDGGISDTCCRDQLIDAFLQEIGIDKPWPINGDTARHKEDFYELLSVKCHEFNVKVGGV